MTQVDFYTGVNDKLHTVCNLSQKAVQNGLRVLVHTPHQSILEALDELLWTYPATSFLPHCRNNAENSSRMPIILSHQDEIFPHHEVLISLHSTCLPFFSRFKRVIEIVSQDTEDARLGRVRFCFYRDHGYNIRHVDLSGSSKNST